MYREMLSVHQPGCIVLLIDQSGSMAEKFAGEPGTKKANECALAVNRLLRETALACQRGDEIRARCSIGLIGYGGGGVGSVFRGELAGRDLVPISDVASSPLRVDMVRQKIPDGAGGIIEVEVPFPLWVEPVAEGGTPMAEALELATQWIEAWARKHTRSFPPIGINITDGVPDDDARARKAADALRAIHTQDGAALLLNAHISTHKAPPLTLPDSEDKLPTEFARLLFRMSSTLPEPLRRSAEAQGFQATEASRGFVYNADVETLVRVLTFGSDPMRPAERQP
jgi:hypothetical protein